MGFLLKPWSCRLYMLCSIASQERKHFPAHGETCDMGLGGAGGLACRERVWRRMEVQKGKPANAGLAVTGLPPDGAGRRQVPSRQPFCQRKLEADLTHVMLRPGSRKKSPPGLLEAGQSHPRQSERHVDSAVPAAFGCSGPACAIKETDCAGIGDNQLAS
jgi:hypothetical protein